MKMAAVMFSFSGIVTIQYTATESTLVFSLPRGQKSSRFVVKKNKIKWIIRLFFFYEDNEKKINKKNKKKGIKSSLYFDACFY